jgi:general secretion pathway protein L
MSMLVILLPVRPPEADGSAAPAVADDWVHVVSPDGLAVTQHGRGTAASLPRADSVVAVLAPTAIAWHRPVLPKAPANRLRAALGGVLEEQLLDDDEAVHLAVEPKVAAGQPAWVAALDKPWLQAQLAVLQAGGVTVDRLVPAQAPATAADGASGHFFLADGAEASDDDAACWLSAADDQGTLCLPLAGSLARARLARWAGSTARFTATPATAATAERWLGQPVAVRTEAEQALAAARSGWNLLQFDLAASHRGTRALSDLGRQLLSPAWRPARWGVLALLAAQVVGLNLWAWHQQQAVTTRRAVMAQLLTTTHPQVKAVLDAPVQMNREAERLRETAGVPGDTDFEPALAAAARGWPDGLPPAPQLRFDNGRLSAAAAGWSAEQVAQLRQRLQPAGWSVEQADGRLTIARAARAAGS